MPYRLAPVRCLLAFSVFLAACGGGTTGTDGSGANATGPAGPVDEATWAQLEAKPVSLKPLEPGQTCPLSDSAMLTGSATGLAFGPGPVYAVPGGPVIILEAKGADGRSTAKVQWIASPQYRGPAVIRGARLDTAGEVRFDGGKTILRLDTQTSGTVGDTSQGSALGWRYLQSVVSVTGPGCYGFQIDLPDGTVSITLRAA